MRGTEREIGQKQSYLLVHQSVTGEITAQRAIARNSEYKAKISVFLPQFVVHWAYSAVYWMDVLGQFRAFITHRMTGESL